MPLLLPLGPVALAATFANYTLTVRLAIYFPALTVIFCIDMPFPPVDGSPRIALYLSSGVWFQLDRLQTETLRLLSLFWPYHQLGNLPSTPLNKLFSSKALMT